MQVCLRCELRIAARVAFLVMMLCGMATLSFAQEDATWSNNALTSDWNYPGNWLPLPLPSSGPLRVPTGLAAFSSSSTIQTITLSAPTTIQTLQFDAPGYTFDLSSTINFLKIAGSGIVAPLAANVPIFKLPDGSLHFINASTAGPASISVSGEGNVTFNFEDRTSANIANAGTATIARVSRVVQGTYRRYRRFRRILRP